MIDEDEILEVAVGTNADLHEACRRLVALANEHGGEDNITAVIVRIEADESASDDATPADAPAAIASASAATADEPESAPVPAAGGSENKA